MPASRGRTRTQSSPGSSGSSMSVRESGPTVAPRPAANRPATAAAAYFATLRSNSSAFIARPSSDNDSWRSAGNELAGSARSLLEVLDQPAALAGDGGESRLRVDGDGEPDGFEHRQIRRG